MPENHPSRPPRSLSLGTLLDLRERKLCTMSSSGSSTKLAPPDIPTDDHGSDKYKMPICTLHLPGSRLYVINSTSLIPTAQKQFKALAFPPLEAMAAKNICGSSKVANDILDTNINGDDGPRSYSVSHYPAVRGPLSPGKGLDAMNRVMAEKVAVSIDGMKTKQRVKLFEFISHEITIATTDSVYGPQNPFKDRKVEDSFWYVYISRAYLWLF